MTRFTRIMLTSLMLLGLLPLPALAQGENESDTVTKTFRLTLLGTVPREEAFRVIYEVGGSRACRGNRFLWRPGSSGMPGRRQDL